MQICGVIVSGVCQMVSGCHVTDCMRLCYDFCCEITDLGYVYERFIMVYVQDCVRFYEIVLGNVKFFRLCEIV